MKNIAVIGTTTVALLLTFVDDNLLQNILWFKIKDLFRGVTQV